MAHRKPLWYPRLRLMPHHFEFGDAYHETLLSDRLATVHEFAWGIVELQVAPRAIESGQFVLSKLRAILPDGTPVEIDEESGRQLGRAFDAVGDGESLDVYIGVPLAAADAPNVDQNGDPRTLRRYIEEKAKVSDLVTGRDSIDVSWARPNVCLLFEGERLDSFSVLRCARLVRPRKGRVTLDQRFVPSVLTLRASPALVSGTRAILQGLTMRQASLVAQRTQPALAEMSGPDALRYWMASVVGSFVPRVADLLEQNAHPHVAYGVLAELQGALAAFTPTGTTEVAKFNYLDLSSTFDSLFASILQILETLGQQQYREIPLRRHDDRLIYGELREPTIFRNEFFLGVVGADVESLRQQAPRLLKIAAWDEVTSLISSAVGGVGIKHEYRAPSVLPSRPGVLYFRLDRSSAAWSAIARKATIGIYHPPDLGSFEVSLFAVDPAVA